MANDVSPAPGQRTPLYLSLRSSPGIPAARQRTRRVAEAVGLPLTDQVRLAIAVSELARCALLEHGGGAIDFALEPERCPAALVVTVTAGVVTGAAGANPPENADCPPPRGPRQRCNSRVAWWTTSWSCRLPHSAPSWR